MNGDAVLTSYELDCDRCISAGVGVGRRMEGLMISFAMFSGLLSLGWGLSMGCAVYRPMILLLDLGC